MKWEVTIPAAPPKSIETTLTVEGDNWMNALQAGLREAGGEASKNLLCNIQADNSIKVTDFRTRRVYRLRPLDADGRPLKVSSSPPAPAATPQTTEVGDTPDRARRRKSTGGGLRVPADNVRAASPAAPVRAGIRPPPDLLTHEVFFQRDENANVQNSITYRERIMSVARGSPQADVERLLRHHFAALRETVETAPPGKFINLSVFDHRFVGRPQRPALGSLIWKDWRGLDPEVVFPAWSDAGPRASTVSAQPRAPLAAVAGSPFAPTAAVGRSSSAPPPAGWDADVELPPLGAVPHESQEPTIDARDTDQIPAVRLPVEPVEPVATAAVRTDTPPPAPAPVAQPGAVAAALSAVADLPAMPAVHPAPLPTPVPAARTRPRSEEMRVDMLAEVFESIQDLFFLQTPEAGANFILELAAKTIPTEASSVLLYDINAHDLRFAATRGAAASKLMGARVPLDKGIAGFCAREVAVLAVNEVQADPRFFADIDGLTGMHTRTLLCCPAHREGRVYAVVELVNRIEQHGFSQTDLNLLSYIAQQFGEFMSIVLSRSGEEDDSDGPGPRRPSRSARKRR